MSDQVRYPIVYLRGYAFSQGEVEDTTATPYMGFNLGSTKIRQQHTGDIVQHVFESPLVRLIKDEGYCDAYRDGQINPRGPISKQSIWIFRYYDTVSNDHGDGERKEIEFHAQRLREFILQIREATRESWSNIDDFRVYLVAHSMGGLVCRAYLQNDDIKSLAGNTVSNWREKGVDKLFTLGTPHGGIEFRGGLGWLSGLRDFMDINNAGNFGAKRMRQFLGLRSTSALHSLNGRFPRDRVFCMIGTDAKDYTAAAGMSRRAVGPLSDGLVSIANATVQGAARSFVHRSHSGHFGIVNSESSYQNMTRFLFGDLRVEGRLLVDDISLPKKVQAKLDDGHKIRASYHFESIVRVRGARWDLSRRLTEENSAVFRKYDDLFDEEGPRHAHLFTTFLSLAERKNTRRKSMGFSVDFAVLVPEYEVDGFLWFDDHYDGGYIYRDKLNFELSPQNDGTWNLRYGFDSKTPNRVTTTLEPKLVNGNKVFSVPIETRAKPGIKASLQLECLPWNQSPN